MTQPKAVPHATKKRGRSLVRKLADIVSPPPPPPQLPSSSDSAATVTPKSPSVLDFDAELPDTELAGIARTVNKATHKAGHAGSKVLKAAELYASAREKLEGNEKFEIIGAVFGHLQGIVATVPLAGPIFTCFKTFVDFEVAAHKSHTAISDLHGRVIFVLDTMRRLDKKREWSKDEDLAHAVLRPLKDPIRACSVLFSDYKGQSWFSRRLYGKSTLNKIGELDASLTSAMADATFALGLTMAGNAMPAIAMDMDPAAQAAADAVARSGGMTVFLKDPAGVTALGKQLAAQLGERFDPGTMLVEVQRGFDERFSALDKSFEDVLTAVATQGKSIDEAKVMLDELCKRNSMYTQIRCAGLRDLWLTAGWGARIKMTVFIDVIIEQLRADVSDAIAISGLSPRKGVIPGHLSALYDGFEKVLLSIDEDQSGTMSPQEVNDFFAFDSWRLMDYFTLVSFFMTTTRAELLKSLQHEFGLIARRLMTPTEDNQYALFFGNLRPTIVAMRDLASEQAETEGALPDWLEHTPALYDRSAMYKRLGKWDWSHMAQYAPPSFANLHAMFAQTVDLAAALEGGIDAFQWTKFETAVRGLESHISEWTPELAKHLIKTVDAALVWHGDGSRFMGDPTARANFEFTATRPFPRVAVMKHTTRRPPNAIVGGTMGGETLYLTTTIYRAKRGKSYRYATYARDVDGEISCISCAPENVSAFSWLVKPKAYDVESTVSKPCQGILEWKSQRLTCAPHPLAGVINIEWSASPVFIARYKRDDDTILPGYIYVDNGVLHFVCAYMVAAENNQHRVIISTQNATKGLGHMGDAKDVSFEFLDREAADIELLVAEADQFPFNSAVSWAHPAELYQESRTTVVAHESVDGRVHLAWCLGESGVYLGTQVEDSEVATYFEPGPGGAGTLTMTTTFLVLTGLWRQWFLSNWSVPHPELEWRQPNRPNLNCSLIAHFATSAGVLTVSRSKSQSEIGLDFHPPGTHETDSMLAYRTRRPTYTAALLGLDLNSAQGNLGALNWWVDAGLPLVYTAEAVDAASAAGHVQIMQWWKDLGRPLRFTPGAVDRAAANAGLESLGWWFANYGTEMKFSVAAIDESVRFNRTNVLEWWTDHGLAFHFTEKALDAASEHAFLPILEWWARSGHELKVSKVGLRSAAGAGHTKVLQFWRTHLSDTEFREKAVECMDAATDHDRLETLNWLRDEGVWGYSHLALEYAAFKGNVPMLQWWYDAGVPLKYSPAAYQDSGDEAKEWWAEKGLDPAAPPKPTAEQLAKVAPPVLTSGGAYNIDTYHDSTDVIGLGDSISLDSDALYLFDIDRACAHGDLEAARAWFASGDHSQYSNDALDCSSGHGHVAIISAWFDSGLPLRYTSTALDLASREGHVAILSAWKASGQEMLYSEAALDSASAAGRTEILQWWMLSGLELRYSELAMDSASGANSISVLNWWTRSGLSVIYSDKSLELASAGGSLQILDWWRESYFQLKYDPDACAVAATRNSRFKVLQWWHDYIPDDFSAAPINAAIEEGNHRMIRWWLKRGRIDKRAKVDMEPETRALLNRLMDDDDDEDYASPDGEDDVTMAVRGVEEEVILAEEGNFDAVDAVALIAEPTIL